MITQSLTQRGEIFPQRDEIRLPNVHDCRDAAEWDEDMEYYQRQTEVYNEAYKRLTWWEKVKHDLLGIPVRKPFEVRIAGPDHDLGIWENGKKVF